jgi:hypothetical protein
MKSREQKMLKYRGRRFVLSCFLFVSATALGVEVRAVQQPEMADPRSDGVDKGSTKDQRILQQWDGDYPVSELRRLPKRQREATVGYIADAATFESVWHAFKPGANAPDVDFAVDLVLFARNAQFYNKTSIAAVKLKDGIVDVVAIETMSSQPIEDEVAFAMVVISREGVTSLKAGDKLLRIPVAPGKPRE